MTVPTPTGRPNKRLYQTVMDMVRSLAVVLGAILVVWLLVWRPTTQTVRVVDVEGLHGMAARQAGFALVLPGDTEGLQATSVRFEPTEASDGAPVWHIGYVAGDQYLQISQAATDSVDYRLEQTADGAEAGAIQIDGEAWTRYQTPERRSLVRLADGVMTVVSGTGEWSQLEQVAGGLVAPPAST